MNLTDRGWRLVGILGALVLSGLIWATIAATVWTVTR